MSISFSTEHKVAIRRFWGKPLLKFIHKQLDSKLLYLGLPSPEIEDLIEWIDHLDQVIAFQCDDERYPDAFEKLKERLYELERAEKIGTFQAYNGYIEEVILQGYDNSNEPQIFDLNELVTIYNLDFCNRIDSPVEIIDREGNLKSVYKFDAVNKLLGLQQSFSNLTSKFVLFLTVHCSYKGGELKDYLETCTHQAYLKDIRSSLKSHDSNARIVRLFVIDTLSTYFRAFGFIPQFFPTVLYSGIKGTPLLHFTVMGTKSEGAGLPPWYQNTGDLIRDKFIGIGESDFVNVTSAGIIENDITFINPVEYFTYSSSFTKYWKVKA